MKLQTTTTTISDVVLTCAALHDPVGTTTTHGHQKGDINDEDKQLPCEAWIREHMWLISP